MVKVKLFFEEQIKFLMRHNITDRCHNHRADTHMGCLGGWNIYLLHQLREVGQGRYSSSLKTAKHKKIVVMDKQTNRTTGQWTNRPTTNWPLVQQANRPRGQWINRPINRQRFTGLRAHDLNDFLLFCMHWRGSRGLKCVICVPLACISQTNGQLGMQERFGPPWLDCNHLKTRKI